MRLPILFGISFLLVNVVHLLFAVYPVLEEVRQHREASCGEGRDEQVLSSYPEDVAGVGEG